MPIVGWTSFWNCPVRHGKQFGQENNAFRRSFTWPLQIHWAQRWCGWIGRQANSGWHQGGWRDLQIDRFLDILGDQLGQHPQIPKKNKRGESNLTAWPNQSSIFQRQMPHSGTLRSLQVLVHLQMVGSVTSWLLLLSNEMNGMLKITPLPLWPSESERVWCAVLWNEKLLLQP